MNVKHLFLSILIFTLWLASSCTEDDVTPEITVYEGSRIVSNLQTKSTILEFDSNTAWSISNPSGNLSISPMSGGSGTQKVTIQVAAANCENDTLSTSLTITAVAEQKTTEKRLSFKIPPLFEIDSEIYKVGPSGGEVQIYFNTEVELSNVCLYYDSVFASMCYTRAETEMREGFSYYGTLKVKENPSANERIGIFCLVDGQNLSDRHSINGYFCQEGNANVSSDYTHDGEVVCMQTHSRGKGFPIVLMGDGFIDRDIASNTYDSVMYASAEGLFMIEPMTSLREYFDIWYVTAVSQTNSISGNGKTAFSSKFTSTQSSEITGDNEKCLKYAQKTGLTDEQLDNALVVVILNSMRYGGTTSLYFQEPKNQCPTGLALAYVPMVDTRIYGIEMETVLQHEVVGHGIAKLADEYGSQESYLINGDFTQDTQALRKLQSIQSQYLYYNNVSLESDPAKSPWATFYADARYASEGLGAYEGAFCYPYGIYRPTDNSLMNIGEALNVVGRSKVYQRVMNVANDFSWTFDYETFVTFDLSTRQSTTTRQSPDRNGGNASALPPLSPPKLIEGRPQSIATH